MNNSAQEKPSIYLQELREELEHFKQTILRQLSEEIETLQNHKNLLLSQIQELETYRQQQLHQQQQLAQQIAPTIAQQLQQIIQQQLAEQGLNNPQESINSLNVYYQKVDQAIASIDLYLHTILQTMQQDLNSYQNSFNQRLEQMLTLERQGEGILEALVSHLKDELQIETPPISLPQTEESNPNFTTISVPPLTSLETPPVTFTPAPPPVVPSVPKAQLNISPPPINQTKKKPTTPKQPNLILGYILIICSALAFYFQNILIAIIFQETSLFGIFNIGGDLTPTLGNAFLILCLRMISFVPILFLITGNLSPQIWPELKRAIADQKLIFLISISGFFLFISSSLIYLALGFIPVGIVITIFFIFPLLNLIFSWLSLLTKPKLIPFLSLLIGIFGLVLTVFNDFQSFSLFGLICAVLSAITFSFHLLVMQFCTKKLEPVPFSLLSFSFVLIFALVSLFIPLPDDWGFTFNNSNYLNLIVSGIFLGLLTLLSYLANNLSVTMIGPARASLFTSIGPILTTFLAWLLLGQALMWLPIFGIIIVTISLNILNLDRFMIAQVRTKK